MTKETIVTAKTVEAAVEAGAAELGTSADKVTYEVLEEPSKGFLGLGASDAKVKVIYTKTRMDLAEDFLRTVLDDMGLEATIAAKQTQDCIKLSVSGDNMGVLIGRHGDVLEALQYLTGFAANKEGGEYVRVQVDAENYRAKREDALRTLARRMAEKAKKFRKPFTLEPMSSYERRIIHSEVQEIPGATTYSVGQGADRRVVVTLEKAKKDI